MGEGNEVELDEEVVLMCVLSIPVCLLVPR